MLIKASFNQEVSTDGDSMVFIPEGIHTITPSVNGKAKEITVRVKAHRGEEIAQRLQASFEARQQSNPVRTIFDFDHKDTGKASALPKRFYYEPGKGVMVERELTGSGAKAIKAKDYSYFSPVFLIGKDGLPSGVPERGPLGALVNDPAFRDIPRIAAKEAAQPNQPNEMELLVKCGILSSVEADKDNAEQIALERVTAMKGDNSKLDELNAKIAELKKQKAELEGTVEASNKVIKLAKVEKADSLVQAAVAQGKICAKDEDSISFWKSSLMSNESAIKALNALPVKNQGITTQQVNASDQNQTANTDSRIEAAQAKARGELGENSPFDQVWARAQQIDPSAFN